MTPESTLCLLTAATLAVTVVFSYFLDHLFGATLPRALYMYALRAPGVVVHECCHVAGCWVSGAPVSKVVLFSEGGGSVTHGPSRIPVLGSVIISTAPLVGIPLVLTLCTQVFSQFLGCTFPSIPATTGTAADLYDLGPAVIAMFVSNIVSQFNPWFLIFLWLDASLVLSLAPSAQDWKNAAAGLAILAAAGLLILWSGIPAAISCLAAVLALGMQGLVTALAFELVALVPAIPLLVWYLYSRTA